MTSTHTLRSSCTRHCANGCALLAEVRPDGQVLLRGNPAHPYTAGFICAKMVNYVEDFLRRPDRITYPQIRDGAGFRQATWEEALDVIAARIETLRATPERMFGLVDWASFGLLAQASRLVLGRLRASKHRGGPCCAATSAAVRADFGAHHEPHWSNALEARTIVLWGRNLDAQSRHLGRVVLEAKAKGATVVAISAGDKGYAPYADKTIVPRPGTDRFLAAAVIKVLAESGRLHAPSMARCAGWDALAQLLSTCTMAELLAACDVGEDAVRALADAYANGPTATILGRGLQRYALGGENVRFVNALAMLSGNVGVAGGGVAFSGGDKGNIAYTWYNTPKPPKRTLPYASLGRAILEAEPAIDFIWTEGVNLVATGQESHALRQALASRFHVAVEPFMTDTAACATVILPPALMLETEDIARSNGTDYVMHSAKLFDAPGECRSNFDIAASLARRLGMDFPDAESVMAQSLRCGSMEELRSVGWVQPPHPGAPWAPERNDGRFAHPDGLYHLPDTLTEEPAAPEGYPWVLGSYIQKATLLSSVPPKAMEGLPVVRVSPRSPALAAIDVTKPIFLATALGRMEVRVEMLEGLHPQLVTAPRGGWLSRGRGLNALIEARETDMGGQAAYYAQHCRLEN